MSNNIFEYGLGKCEANYASLSPLGFLERAASVYPDHTAVIDEDRILTWSQVYARCVKMASALHAMGIGSGDTVSVLAPNSIAAFESHYSIPMAGAVLNAINTRLDASMVAFILEHGESRLLIVDRALESLTMEVCGMLNRHIPVIWAGPGSIEPRDGGSDYDNIIECGDGAFAWQLPDDEWDAISLNYTSGTTGNPKGVVYHHRGAYLNAISNAVGWSMPHHPVYLWTLPMFHCNGWCFPWTLAALAGVSVCLRDINAGTIFEAIDSHGIDHFCGAPVIMNMLINASDRDRRPLSGPVKMMTAAAPPPASVLAAMESQGFLVTHVYGLTETYGPAVMCAWHSSWDQLESDAKAEKKSRQGVRYHALESLDVCDPESGAPMERDGESLGEVTFRGNIVMKGYLKNEEATNKAFRNGHFNSGDLGVMHDDNYIQLKDRSKDIIISGGENISSIEIEDCLYRHPSVLEVAVVARPDEYWGETPCAFVALADAADITESELIVYCRENLPHFKCPKLIVFGELPKTSTGKIQKFKLREKAAALPV
ncbi:MAG: acyl-CoA synthetase [Pseudomonadota bacterium]